MQIFTAASYLIAKPWEHPPVHGQMCGHPHHEIVLPSVKACILREGNTHTRLQAI